MIDLEEQLNFTNKQKHPTNDRMAVYRYVNRAQAEYFATLLTEAGIAFEQQVDEEHDKKPVYFGIARIDEKKADHLNFIALGKDRPKFIDLPVMRWLIIGISALVIALAIAGAILSS